MPSMLGWSSAPTASSRRASISSPLSINSSCVVPNCFAVRRAIAASLNSASGKATVKVCTPETSRLANAASAVESIPLLKKTPTGTSAIRCRRTLSSSSSRTRLTAKGKETRAKGKLSGSFLTLCSSRFALCSLPFALCSSPSALCPSPCLCVPVSPRPRVPPSPRLPSSPSPRRPVSASPRPFLAILQ